MSKETNIIENKEGMLWQYRGSRDILIDGNRFGKRICTDVFTAKDFIPSTLTQDAHKYFQEYSKRSHNAISRMQDHLNKYIPEHGVGFCLEKIEDGFIISPESDSACLLRVRFLIDGQTGEVWRIVAHGWHSEAVKSVTSFKNAFTHLNTV